LLIPVALFASTLAGALGLGGGILLITLMPGFIPAGAILPLHAVTQLASNVSRASFGWRHIDFALLIPIALGSALGAIGGAGIYQRIAVDWLPAVIGMVVLLVLWVPLPRPKGSGVFALALLGFYQTGLGMLAGATGPLGAAVLSRYNTQRDWLVVNTSVYMTMNHLFRIGIFLLMGFVIGPWLPLLLGMICASVLGSWLGTRLRAYVPQANFERWFRFAVSLLALRMIAMAWLDRV